MELQKRALKKEYIIKVNGMYVSHVGTSEISFSGDISNAKRFNSDAMSLGRLVNNIYTMVRLGMDDSQIDIVEIETLEEVIHRRVDIETIGISNGIRHGKVVEKEVNK